MALSSYEFSTRTQDTIIDKYKKDAKFFLALRISVKRRYSDDIDYKEYEPQVQKLIDKHITTEGEVLKVTELVNIFDKEQREAEVEKLVSKAAKADHIASRTIKAINVKMDEDPIFYKKLSRLIKEVIDDYHQQRINEAEYLSKAKELENSFLNGQKDNIPENLKDNENGIALFNLITDIFKQELENKQDISAEIAQDIDNLIRSIVYEGGTLMVDWQNKSDVEGQIRIAIDDYFFEIKTKYEIEFSFEKIDQMVEDGLKVAKLKFK